MIKALIGIRLRKLFVGTIFMGEKKKSATVGKIVLGVVLYFLIIASFLLMTVSIAASLAMVLVPRALDWLYFLLYFIAVFSILFIFGIFESKAELFECKDNAILIPLPISARDIVCSRVLVLMLYHYLECAFIFLPAMIFYLIFGGTPLALLGGAVFFLVMPAVTASLSAIFGFFLSKLTARVKNKTVFTLVCALAFLALYFLGYSALMNGMDAVLENFDSIAADLSIKMSALRFLGEIVLAKPLPLILFILIGALLTYLCLRVVISFYFRTVTEQNTGAVLLHNESTARTLPPMLALIQKELRRFTSSANYMLNCGIGLLMAPIAGVFAIIKRDDLSALCAQLEIELSMATPIAIAILGLCLMMNFMSGVSFSLEGKSFWILRSMPLCATDIIFSKVFAAALVSAPFSVVSSTLFVIALRPGVPEALALYLLPLALSLAASLFYAMINIIFPKMQFDNEAAVIKQSVSAFIGSLGSMALGVALVYLGFICIILSANWIFYLTLIALALLIGVPSAVLLTTVFSKKIEKM